MKTRYIYCFFISLMFINCNGDFDKIIPETKDEPVNVIYGEPKVLLIVVDGIRGLAMKDEDIPNINALLPHSIYSWNGLSEENATDRMSNWMNIFTGVNYVKHGVIGEDLSNNQLHSFPLIFKRIKDFNPDIKSHLISSNDAFIQTFGEDAEKSLESSDLEVKNKAIDALQTKDLSFLSLHFQNPYLVGEDVGYEVTTAEYKSELLTFDSYVGEILEALENRETYDKEDWLVILTSSQGGYVEIPEEQNDNTIFSEPEVNTFTVIYSPKFSQSFINKPYIGSKFVGDFMNFKDEIYAELEGNDNQYFDLGEEEFTIEVKLKKNKGPNNYNYSFPSIIGKRAHWQSDWQQETDGIGWVIHLAGDSWIFNARGEDGTGEVKADEPLSKATWNTLTVTGKMDEEERKISLYTNGNLSKEGSSSSWGEINSAANLRIGYLPNKNGWKLDAYIADVKFWKKALPEDVVRQYSCDVGVDPTHPYFEFLAAHWPIMGSENSTVFDEGPIGAHLTIGGGSQIIDRLNDYMCVPPAEDLGTQVPRTVDISTQIISWFKIPRLLGWQLDGRVWLGK